MAEENMRMGDKATTTDAHMFTLPTQLLSPAEQEETPEEESSEPKPNDHSFPNIQWSANGSIEKQKSQVPTYNLEKYQEHAMLVINHNNIIGYKPRYGTIKDGEALRDTFTKLGFKVDAPDEPLIKEKVLREVQNFCSRDFTNIGCVVVAVLTHGKNNGDLLSADGCVYNERDIIKYLKCSNNKTLLGKPRILIIQACRGFGVNLSNTKGVTVFETEKTGKSLEDTLTLNTTQQEEEIKHYSLSLEANMLVVHSSYPAKNSFRHPRGSWLIQTLCSKINQLASTVDLSSILTEIKRDVAIERQYTVFNRGTFETDFYKQMPVTTSTLTKKLYLKHCAKPYARYCKDPSKSLSGPQMSQGANQNLEADAALPVQYGPCFCFLDRFNYMLNCLKCYLKDHSDDTAAMMCYNVAVEFQNGPEFHGAKEKMLKSMSKCLNKSTFKYHKYIHFYN